MSSERYLTQRAALIASAVTLAVLFALSAWAWAAIEGDSIPVHWGISGEPDRYGGKFEGLMVLPLIAVGLVALFAVIPRIEPRREHMLRSMPAYVLLWLALLAYLLLVHGALLTAAFGHDVNMSSALGSGIGLLFVVIGAVLGRVRSNFFVGVRTPWTLSSEYSWHRTHALAGRLFMAAGVSTVIAGVIGLLTDLDWLPIVVLLIGATGAALGSVVYSYFAWRADPDRTHTGAQAGGP